MTRSGDLGIYHTGNPQLKFGIVTGPHEKLANSWPVRIGDEEIGHEQHRLLLGPNKDRLLLTRGDGEVVTALGSVSAGEGLVVPLTGEVEVGEEPSVVRIEPSNFAFTATRDGVLASKLPAQPDEEPGNDAYLSSADNEPVSPSDKARRRRLNTVFERGEFPIGDDASHVEDK